MLSFLSPTTAAWVALTGTGRRPLPAQMMRTPLLHMLEEGERTFEICVVKSGEIDECRIVGEEELPEVVGFDQAARVLSDPSSSELYFDMNTTSLSVNDWRLCLDEDVCEIPDDVILKAMGPDALSFKESASREEALVLPQSARSRFHLHFGAGRLGMGLVVPAISASGIPFAVVQRPKPRWRRLFAQEGASTRADQLSMTVNSKVFVHNVEVIEGCEGSPTFMPPQSLVFGSTPEELNDVVERATSFSCSLGGAMASVLLPLLESLPVTARDNQPQLFCCENDHDAVKALKEQLEGKVFVIDCMVDRVCTGRTVTAEGIDVAAEPWHGSIVVMEPGLKGRLPFTSRVATAPQSAREADYLSERKFSLVNGMHTVLAFMTLLEQFEDDDGGREYILLKYSQLSREGQRMCEAWRTARAAQLLQSYGTANLMEWHEVATREEAWGVLLDYADNVLEERFSKTDDVVSRVLGGGVSNRWLTRLRPTDAWMLERRKRSQANDAELEGFFAFALSRDRNRAIERGCLLSQVDWVGCDVEEEVDPATCPEGIIASYLSSLTSSARRFTTREAEITHKELITAKRAEIAVQL